MSEEIDYSSPQAAALRAICRHQLSALEMLLAVTVVRLSFGLGKEGMKIKERTDLRHLAGISGGKSTVVLRRLVCAGVLSWHANRRTYSFILPTVQRPWIFPARGDWSVANRIEDALLPGPMECPLVEPL